jgi:hypothetical protein
MAAKRYKLVVGIFGHPSDAVFAIRALKQSGIMANSLSVVAKQKAVMDRIHKDAGIGEIEVGAGNMGLFGTIKGIAAALDLLPDRAVAAGPAARKLAGAELSEAEGDGLSISLMGIGIPKEDAEQYARHADKEHVMVMVVLDNDNPGSDRVDAVFSRYHALPLGEE